MIFQNPQAVVGWSYVRTDEITSSISLMMSERDIIHVFYKPSKVLHKVASRNLLTESHLERLLFFVLEEERKNTRNKDGIGFLAPHVHSNVLFWIFPFPNWERTQLSIFDGRKVHAFIVTDQNFRFSKRKTLQTTCKNSSFQSGLQFLLVQQTSLQEGFLQG